MAKKKKIDFWTNDIVNELMQTALLQNEWISGKIKTWWEKNNKNEETTIDR